MQRDHPLWLGNEIDATVSGHGDMVTAGKSAGRKGTVKSNVSQWNVDYAEAIANRHRVLLNTQDLVTVMAYLQRERSNHHRRSHDRRRRPPTFRGDDDSHQGVYITFETQSGELWAAVTYLRVEQQQHGHPETTLLYGPNAYGWARGYQT